MQTDAQSLRDLLGRRPSRIELDRAALEIAKIEYPDLDADASISQLDSYALAIAERGGAIVAGISSVWMKRGRDWSIEEYEPTLRASSLTEAVGLVLAASS